MVGMNRWLIEALECWFRFPRVILLYVPLYAITAVPMFTSDPDNPARAFSFVLMLWISLTVVSAVVATIAVGVLAANVGNEHQSKGSDCLPYMWVSRFTSRFTSLSLHLGF